MVESVFGDHRKVSLYRLAILRRAESVGPSTPQAGAGKSAGVLPMTGSGCRRGRRFIEVFCIDHSVNSPSRFSHDQIQGAAGTDPNIVRVFEAIQALASFNLLAFL
jgi:hypothetical protein